MAEIVRFSDLPVAVRASELIDLMIAGANAKAARVAPCLVATDPAPSIDALAEAKLVLVGAVKRWAEAGAGALSAQTAGPFSQTIDTRQRTGFNLWPSEIEQLQAICSTGQTSGAFAVDTVGCPTVHADICALTFGATYCSCGADVAGFPLYEADV